MTSILRRLRVWQPLVIIVFLMGSACARNSVINAGDRPAFIMVSVADRLLLARAIAAGERMPLPPPFAEGGVRVTAWYRGEPWPCMVRRSYVTGGLSFQVVVSWPCDVTVSDP